MTLDAVTLRRAVRADRPAVIRLAQRDCAAVPAEPLLVAEVNGRLRAVRSLATGAVIADPFVPSAHLVSLLVLHARGAPRTHTPRRPARRRLALPRALAPLPGR